MRESSTPTLGIKRKLETVYFAGTHQRFFGGMVGLERTILPEIAETEFGCTYGNSFIVVFGITKALSNYYRAICPTVWPEKKADYWMAFWPACAIYINICGKLELNNFCQQSPGHYSGTGLVG